MLEIFKELLRSSCFLFLALVFPSGLPWWSCELPRFPPSLSSGFYTLPICSFHSSHHLVLFAPCGAVSKKKEKKKRREEELMRIIVPALLLCVSSLLLLKIKYIKICGPYTCRLKSASDKGNSCTIIETVTEHTDIHLHYIFYHPACSSYVDNIFNYTDALDSGLCRLIAYVGAVN